MNKFSIKSTDLIKCTAYFKNVPQLQILGNYRNIKDIKQHIFEQLPYELSYKKIGFEIENLTQKKVTYFNAFDN